MFNVGDKIVYPMHGAGTIDAIEEKDILGERQAYYIIKMPGEVKVMVPTAKAEEIGVRNIINKENAGKVFSIDQIYENVWNELSFAPENTVSVHIRRIREKIEINPKEPRYLKVVWGIGYKIEKN